MIAINKNLRIMTLGVLWVVSELINPDLDEAVKKNYTVAGALSRIDVPSVLFFLGILLAVGALESMQVLHQLATWLDQTLGDQRIIVTLIGVLSAIVDNVRASPALQDMLAGLLSPRHPSQVYEALLEGALLFVILWILRTRARLADGVLTGVFFISYAVLRIFCEQFREPDAPLHQVYPDPQSPRGASG